MSDEEDETIAKPKGNALPLWGNVKTMNINNLIVTNILSSPYFKNELIKMKTLHEVIDEIYYKVEHLEPWERGSRKTHGQVGMCGGVRGVGAGGIVSSGYCLLFKLFTLKLTKKQVYVLLDHCDSPYIRGIGFMFIRYCQPPSTFWEWYSPYLEDDEPIDPKAGDGCPMTIGQMVRSFLLKLDWYGTLFPRIPVPIHKEIEASLKEINLCDDRKVYADEKSNDQKVDSKDDKNDNNTFGEAERFARKQREDQHSSSREHSRSRNDKKYRSDSREKHRSDSKDKHRSSRDDRDHKSSRNRSRSRERHRDSHHKHSKRDRRSVSKERRRPDSRRRSNSRERRR